MLLLLSLACDADDDEVERRPAADHAVVGVSGHCFSSCTEDLNVEYLGGEGTLDAIARAFDDADGEVGIGAFGDEYLSWEWIDSGEPIVYGFVDLVYALEYARDEWIDDAHRLSVVCHSHGCVWAHTALLVVDDVEVDWLVDLDAESLCWEDDLGCAFAGDSWADEIDPDDWPYDIRQASNAWDIPGVPEYQDVEDVVPYNVRHNLEVASDDATFLQDAEPNHRPDGDDLGIDRYQSGENHENCDAPDADGVRWAVEQIEEAQ